MNMFLPREGGTGENKDLVIQSVAHGQTRTMLNMEILHFNIPIKILSFK